MVFVKFIDSPVFHNRGIHMYIKDHFVKGHGSEVDTADKYAASNANIANICIAVVTFIM